MDSSLTEPKESNPLQPGSRGAGPPGGAQQQKQQEKGEHILFIGAKWALVGGILAAGIAFLGRLLVGEIYSGAEARGLLEAMVPSARSVGTAVVAASATILALMLTMLSLTRQASSRMEMMFFKRVERIGLMSTIALSTGILLLLFLSIPLEQSKNLPNAWFAGVYYVVIFFTTGLAGLLVSIVLMLFNAMQSLIQVLSPTAPGDAVGMSKRSQVSDPNE